MSHTRYIISDASKQVDVEPHVLRYWEEELELAIPRNEMGHRYYREEDIQQMKGIKKLKEQGFQLKAVKLVLDKMEKIQDLDLDTRNRLRDELNEKVSGIEQGKTIPATTNKNEVTSKDKNEKMDQFQTIMTNLIKSALSENNLVLADTVSKEVSTSVVKAMDYKMREQEEKDEAYYRKLDETLRLYQQGKKEVAATVEPEKKKRKFFKKGKKVTQ